MQNKQKTVVTIQGVELQVVDAFKWWGAYVATDDWTGIKWTAYCLNCHAYQIMTRVIETVEICIEGAPVTYYLNEAYCDSGSEDYCYFVTCSIPNLLKP